MKIKKIIKNIFLLFPDCKEHFPFFDMCLMINSNSAIATITIIIVHGCLAFPISSRVIVGHLLHGFVIRSLVLNFGIIVMLTTLLILIIMKLMIKSSQ